MSAPKESVFSGRRLDRSNPQPSLIHQDGRRGSEIAKELMADLAEKLGCNPDPPKVLKTEGSASDPSLRSRSSAMTVANPIKSKRQPNTSYIRLATRSNEQFGIWESLDDSISYCVIEILLQKGNIQYPNLRNLRTDVLCDTRCPCPQHLSASTLP